MPSSALTTPTETSFSATIPESGSMSSGYASNSSSLSSNISVASSASEVYSTGTPASSAGGGITSAVNVSSVSTPAPPGSTVPAEKKDKTGTKPTKKERLPRIQLKRITGSPEGPVAECSFDTYKNNRITFKFGIDDDEPDEVAVNMVICTVLLLAQYCPWCCW